jgi:hypothetical protein
VHLLGSPEPSKSGVAVGVGLAAFAVQKAKDNRTQARTARMDEPNRRNSCGPLETMSNFFIKSLLLLRNKYPIGAPLRSTEIPRSSRL